MNSKLLFSIIAVLVIIGLAYFFTLSQPKSTNKANLSGKTSGAAASATAKMPETNPFKTKVNPMQGYTNPFSK
ncbi:MAG: hypothetical protein NTY04_01815 [Candidatus Staskawiczbacteria bacterium]|nr:hypothetical protein [Candidatus Staskawiczbacteria bacterium]